MDDRLYRSRTDRILTGVAGGLAERMDVDPSLVRVVWVLLAIFSGGIFALIYVVMAVVVSERPVGSMPSRGAAVAPATDSGWSTTGATSETGAAAAGTSSEPAPPGSWIGPDGQPVPDASSGLGATEGRPRRPGLGAIIFGGILILVGVWTLIERYVPAIDTSTIWPVVVIGLGILLVALAFLRPSRT